MDYKQKYIKYKKKYSLLKNKMSRSKFNNFNMLNNFLSEEKSNGLYASKGNINYNIFSTANIYNFFYILIENKIFSNKLLYIPDFITDKKINNNNLRQNVVLIDIINFDYFFPKSMITSYKKGLKSRFIFTTLLLYSENDNYIHSNLIIIDNKKKTFERFEPKGKNNVNNKKYFYIDQKINNILINIIKNKLKLKSYKFISQSEISLNIGIQLITDKNYETLNFCNTINMIYLNLRLLYPDIKQSKIIDYFVNIKNDVLIDTLLKYAKYVEDTLKNNFNIIEYLYKQTQFDNDFLQL
tara:strand:- start:3282 stop:4172 length:891 start_codon:yes stop_codon:yes gene_type:complete